MRSLRHCTAELGRAVCSQVRCCRVRSARVITCCLPAEELPLHIGALLDQRVLALVRSRQVGHHDIGKGARSLGGKAAANLSSSKGRSTLWALGRRRALRWRLCRHVGFHHLLHLELRGGGGLGSKAHCSHRVVVSDLLAAGCKERTKLAHNSVLFFSVEAAPLPDLLPEQHGLLLFQPV